MTPIVSRTVLLVASLLVLVTSCGGCDERGAHVERAAREAGREWRVPVRLLLALAYADSRLTLGDGSGYRNIGWIRLPSWRSTRSSALAARLLGHPRAELERNAVLGMRGAAALLASHARTSQIDPKDGLEAWGPALEAFAGLDSYSNTLYADHVVDLAIAGFRGVDDFGRPVRVAPTPGDDRPSSPMRGATPPPEMVGMDGVAFFPAHESSHRPPENAPRDVRYIVIHTTQDSFHETVSLFIRRTTETASHYVIRAGDGAILQMVDEREVAFHDACFNEHSIGIEHEGYVLAGRRWYSDAMYAASARLVRDIADRHGIPLDREHILGHGDAPDCSDHWDPGPHWDWERFMELVRR